MNGLGFIIGLVISFVFAGICASIAESKNRSAGLWGVLGFFGGLLVVIIILILEDESSYGHSYSTSSPMYPEPKKHIAKKPVEIKPTEQAYNNYQYIQLEPIRCPKIILRQYPYKSAVVLKIRSYEQALTIVKADLEVTDIFDDKNKIESVIFDLESPDEQGWQMTKEVILQTETKLKSEHVSSVDVIVKSVVFADNSKMQYDSSSYVETDDSKPLAHLRVLYGDDVFAEYKETGMGYICVCGKNNTDGKVDCTYCGRSVESMSREIDDLALLSGFQTCETLEEGQKVFDGYKHTLPEALAEKIEKKIKADIYVWKNYGMHDQKAKIKQWIDIMEE